MPEDLVTRAVVEIPKGTFNKYEFDMKTGHFRLNRVLHSAVHYPVEYGFVPDTAAQDGDPLDIMLLVTHPTFPGCLIDCRVVGMLEMADENGPDDKLLAVPLHDPRFLHIAALDDVPSHTLKEIAHFFQVYKTLEHKEVTVKGWKGVPEAGEVLRMSVKRAGGS